ncbi:hypothetical protein JTB14_023593 [Gonioctena quinquepunctata]|nr:hypothetical protein JTB14_023593 [Gonioctena quinquepunctata]
MFERRQAPTVEIRLLYLFEGRKILTLAVYEDDLLILSNDKQMREELKRELTSTFKMVDMGKAERILGFEFKRDRNKKKIWINEERYIDQMLKRFNMHDCHPSDMPMVPGLQLSKEQCPTSSTEKIEMAKIPYQEAVGSLLFASQVSRS